jgi:chromosome segregation ATPase
MINRLILESKIAGLQNQLNVLIAGDATTTGLSQLIASGITAGATYDNLMNKIEIVAEELAEAQLEYDQLTATQNLADMSIEYQVTMIKIETYTAELNALQEKLAALYTQMINMENGQSSHSDLDRISAALSEIKQELESLEIQLGYDRVYAEAEINNAQDRVNTLSTRLNDLNGELAVLISDIENAESLETGYLVAGNPSNPISVLPERAQARNTLIMGAILGVVVAWLILNFRWIIHSLSKRSSTEDGDMED